MKQAFLNRPSCMGLTKIKRPPISRLVFIGDDGAVAVLYS